MLHRDVAHLLHMQNCIPIYVFSYVWPRWLCGLLKDDALQSAISQRRINYAPHGNGFMSTVGIKTEWML